MSLNSTHKNPGMRYLPIIASLIFCILFHNPALAQITDRDIQIVARTLGFLDPPMSGNIRMGILHDPSSTRSAQEAENVRRLTANGLQVGNMTLRPVMLDPARVDSAQIDFILLVNSNGSASVLPPPGSNQPCITTDLARVQNGECHIGIQSTPRVQILVNRQAAINANLRFATAFRMMISEI